MEARWRSVPQACLLIILLTCTPGDTTVTDCPAGYEGVMDRCYRFHNAGGNTVSWNMAENDCLADGGFLVGLETPGEYRDIVDWVRLKAPSGVELWTTLQEDADYGWHWSNTADRWVLWWPGDGNEAGETVGMLITRDPASDTTVGMADSNVNSQRCCYICEYASSRWEAFTNVARTPSSIDCSSVGYGSCLGAVDGRLILGDVWATRPGEGVGAWIQMTFDAVYTLTFMRSMPRYGSHELNKDILVTFDEGKELKMTLERVYTAWDDYNGQVWNERYIDDVSTSMARIQVTSVYTVYYNGFSEIEFYVGTNPCPPRYTLVGNTCYRYVLDELVAWETARQACDDLHSDLVSMETAGKRDEITAWIMRSFSIDGALFWTSGKLSSDGGTWQWGDSDDTWFDWEPSQPGTSAGEVAALNTDTMQLLASLPTDANRYICEYSRSQQRWVHE